MRGGSGAAARAAGVESCAASARARSPGAHADSMSASVVAGRTRRSEMGTGDRSGRVWMSDAAFLCKPAAEPGSGWKPDRVYVQITDQRKTMQDRWIAHPDVRYF
jgi:hypothetical protein